MNEEGLNPIEREDRNIPQPLNAQQDQPSPEDVFNRIVLFEATLKTAWENFMQEVKFIFTSLDNDIDRLRTEVVAFKNSQLHVGSSVVILSERKIGVIMAMTKTHVKVKIDDEETIVSKTLQRKNP